MVVFATPGMLHAGLSLQIFRKWAEDEKNMVRGKEKEEENGSGCMWLCRNGGVVYFVVTLPSQFVANPGCMCFLTSDLQLIMPGYCVAGTVGHKVLGGAKKIEIDKKVVNVKLSVQYMSFR